MVIFGWFRRKPDVNKLYGRRDVGGLIKALKYEDEQIRRAAAEALGKIHDRKAVRPLIEALKDDDWNVRMLSAWSLGQIRAETAVEPLVDGLSDERLEVRRASAESLSRIGAPAIISLIRVFGSHDSQLCRRVEYVLWNIGQQAVEPLIKALSNEDWRVRMNAAITLGHINYKRMEDAGRLTLDPSAIHILNKKITGRHYRDESRAVEPLIERLSDEEPFVRRYAAYALGKMGDSRAFNPLGKLLDDEDEAVRRSAEEARRSIRDSNPKMWAEHLKAEKNYQALAAIFHNQEDPHRFAKQPHAREALREAGPEAVDTILEEYASGWGNEDLARLLVDIGDPKAVPLLKKKLDRGSFNISHLKKLKERIEEFVDRYPELHGPSEELACALCGKTRPVNEMRGAGDKFFCPDTCWGKRGLVLGSKLPSAKQCPYYSEGMCTAKAGDWLCSLKFGSYETTCYVYKMAGSRTI